MKAFINPAQLIRFPCEQNYPLLLMNLPLFHAKSPRPKSRLQEDRCIVLLIRRLNFLHQTLPPHYLPHNLRHFDYLHLALRLLPQQYDLLIPNNAHPCIIITLRQSLQANP